ncbi:SH3 domain-binding protein 4-A isoform X1 [Gambusia affinis]|uniref:SH3 domain-binding protein 4-A isoform X1 n=1 Tax=Gambusia affinis TaxID=33528 RepID=UPI001CDC7766|nr:SH3 domain-binding protein 4-A isoform X1 [Gambusia affinis]
MAAHRIIRVNHNHILPRCKSEGTLIELDEGPAGASLSDVKVPSPSALKLDSQDSLGAAQEVVAIKDYCPSSFTTLKFSKGDHLYVLDTSGGEWWYAHNNTEMGYIPAAYVQPVNFRNSSLSDSGMIDSLGEGYDDGGKEFGGLGEWMGMSLKPSTIYNNTPFSVNPFICPLNQNSKDVSVRNSADLIYLESLASPSSCSNSCSVMSNGFSSCHINSLNSTSPNQEVPSNFQSENPFFKSKRSHSLSELSVLQAQSNPTLPSSGFFTGLMAPLPEQFQSREDFRTAWLNHRKLARSCHDLDSLGQSPGWGQTQPVETNIVCRLDCNGGVVQLPDTHISVHIPEGHVGHGDYQQISMKALLDPPLELNSNHCTTVSPVVEIKLSNMETKSFLTLEIKVSVAVKKESCHAADVLCVRSDCKEGPYTPIPNAYIFKDTVQVQLDSLEPCMYVAVVVQAQYVGHNTTVWDHVQRKVSLGVYGPKHIHPSFKTVVAMFGHDCAPKTLLVNDVTWQAASTPPVALQLWGKHQFVLPFPQDLQIGLYSNMSNYQVKASEGTGIIRGFQVKLGKVSRLLFMITSLNPSSISDFTLRVQVKDALDCILTQFCVQTPQPPPKTGARITGQRRFLKKREVDKIVLSPLAVTSKHPKFQDRCVTNLKFGKLIKTVIRQHKNMYLLEYKKGDVIALLSEEKIKLRGQLRTKEWYIGYYQGKLGLVHAKNVLVLGKVKPIYWCGPDLTTTMLLDQILKPCKFLTYIYATVRTVLMENVGSWRAFADALGYGNLPLNYFCRTELDNEPERVASVLEKLKEECTNMENKERKSFQRELMMALLKMDCQGLVAKLVLDFVLLTTAVEVASRWRELAEKLARVSRQQMEAYEAPHRDKNCVLDNESMWKPAYDFLLTWAAHVGDSYRDVIQELHHGLDKMRNPITKRWKHLTGALILVNCLDSLRSAAFCPTGYGDFAV